MSQKSYSLISKFLNYFLATGLIVGSFQTLLSQVISHKTSVYIHDDGKKTTKKTILVQVNNKQENWLSHIELKHNPKQDFIFNYASIVDIDGNTKKLKKKELITRNDLSNQAFYQDDLITEFDLYWNQYPYKVKYSYTIEEEEYLYLAWWTPVLYTNAPTIDSSLEINLPINYKIHINSSENLTCKESEIEGRKIYSWRSFFEELPRKEVFSPPTLDLLPIVKIVPSEFKYGVSGSSDSWSSFGSWLKKLNEGTDRLPLHEKLAIEKLIHGIEDKDEIIKAIYYYLQDHTKYVNVAIDVGGLKSYPAYFVYKNKYGDCKALTTYMKAMLKSVGIESFYTVIKAGKNETEIDLNFPSQQFNHVILMIPSTKDTIWLENTSNSLPFNYLGTFTQNRYALVVNGGESQLVKTPEILPTDVLLERGYNFQLSSNYETSIDINLTLRGSEFEYFRYFISEKNEKRQNDEMLEHSGISRLKVKELSTIDFHRDSSFVSINVKGESNSIVRKIGPYKVINPLRIDLPSFEQPSERDLDVVINYPINKSDKSVYELKYLGLNDIQIPEGIKIKGKYGLYHTAYFKENNKLIVDEKFTLFANKIPIDKYRDFYQFIESIINHKKKTAILIK